MLLYTEYLNISNPLLLSSPAVLYSCEFASALSLAEKRLANQQPPYLASPGADFVQLRVPQQPAGRVLIDVAVASKQL